MDFDNRKVYGDTSITDGLVYPRKDNVYATLTVPVASFFFHRCRTHHWAGRIEFVHLPTIITSTIENNSMDQNSNLDQKLSNHYYCCLFVFLCLSKTKRFLYEHIQNTAENFFFRKSPLTCLFLLFPQAL